TIDALLAAEVLAGMPDWAVVGRVAPTRLGFWGISKGGWIAPLATAAKPAPAFLVAVSAAGGTPGEQMAFATRALMREAGYGDEEFEQRLTLRGALDDLPSGRMSPGDAQALVDCVAGATWLSRAVRP